MKPLVLTPSRTAAIPLTATSSTLERRISVRSASPLHSPPPASSPNHLYRSASSIRTYSSPPPSQAGKRRSLGYVSTESQRSSNNSFASSSLARDYSHSSNVTTESPDSSVIDGVDFEGEQTQWGSEKMESEYSLRDERADERLETAFEVESEMELERQIRSVVRVRQVSITPRILDYSHPRDDSSETISDGPLPAPSPFNDLPSPPTIALSRPSPPHPISDLFSLGASTSNRPTRPLFDRSRNSITLSPPGPITTDSPLSVISEPPSPPPSFPLPRLPANSRPASKRSSVDSNKKSSNVSISSSQSSQEDFRLSTYSVDQFLDPEGRLPSDSSSRRRARSSLVSIAPSIRRLDSWTGGFESAGGAPGVRSEHFDQRWHEDLLSTLDNVAPHPSSSTASILADYTFGAAPSKSAIPSSTLSIADKPLPALTTISSSSSTSSKDTAAPPTGERAARPRKLSPTSLATLRNSLFNASSTRTAPASPSLDDLDTLSRPAEYRTREGSVVSLSPTKSRTMPLPRVGSISGAAGSPAKPSAAWPPPDEPTRTITAGKQLVSLDPQSPSRASLKRANSSASSSYPGYYLSQSTRREPRDPRGKIEQDDMSLRDFFDTTPTPAAATPPRSISPLTSRSSYSNYSNESITPTSQGRFGAKLFSGFAKGGEANENGLQRKTSRSSITERFSILRATNLTSFGNDAKSPQPDSDDVLEIIVPSRQSTTQPFLRIMTPRAPQSLSSSLSSTPTSSPPSRILPISSIFPVRKSTVFPSRLTGSSNGHERI